MLGISVEQTCSPEVQRKVTVASTECSSYASASTLLKELLNLAVPEKQCERISQRIGNERLAEREIELQTYERLTLPEQQQAPPNAPQNVWKGRVATIMVDGGRTQLRDERWGKPHPPGEKPNWWRELKATQLTTFSGEKHESDPIPDVPACLLDPLWVIPRVKEIKSTRNGEAPAEESPEAAVATPESDKPPRWCGEPLVRSVVATYQPYKELGRLAKVEAYRRGFMQADRKAFLGDGQRANWSIQQTHFSDYTAITDLMHALAYVYDAARDSASDMEEGWDRYKRWVQWVWQGQVEKVIEELRPLTAAAQQAEDSQAESLQSSLTYLSNNQDRMRYDQYRKSGLPITTAHVESCIKRLHRRMKGTEKFWKPGAEPQLQLVTDRISETQPLKQFWQRRARRQTGFRKSRAAP